MFYFYRRDRKGELVFDRDVKDTADFQGYTMREVRGSFLVVCEPCVGVGVRLIWCARVRACVNCVACVQGIGYETKDTVQGTLRSSTGLHGHRSGDGTVPYVSLNYCTEWRQDLELRIEELEGVEHREILSTGSTKHAHAQPQCLHTTRHATLTIITDCGCATDNRLFFRLLIEHVSEPLTLRQRRERETVVLGCIDDERDDTYVDA
jgi:hypothetical protein